jgi:hypothetical protein
VGLMKQPPKCNQFKIVSRIIPEAQRRGLMTPHSNQSYYRHLFVELNPEEVT